MRVAVVICSRDRPRFLDEALNAIRAAKRPGDEVIVVDSASTDPAVREVVGRHSDVIALRCDEPGAARARNLGARVASAPVLAFTDDDCRPESGWTEALASVFAAERRVGFVTGRVVPDRSRGPLLSVGGGDDPRRFEYGADPAELGHGANLAVRRDALEAVEGFDEALGAGVRLSGAEDHDLMWRILRAGWLGRYEPRASVVHHQWRTRRQYLRAQYGYGLGSGAFGVKAVRLDGRVGVPVLRDGLWRRGAWGAVRALRQRHETAAAGNAMRFAGTLVGALRAWRIPLDGDRYAPRDPQRRR